MPKPCSFAACDCNHDRGEHRRSGGACKGTDSYGLPCRCPSYVHQSDCTECGGAGVLDQTCAYCGEDYAFCGHDPEWAGAQSGRSGSPKFIDGWIPWGER